MSVIQKIRDKYARWAVIAIAVSLLGFILMDAFAGRTGLFSERTSNTLGEVNGKSINRLDFDQKVKTKENQYAAQGYQVGDEMRQQISQSAWDEEVNDRVMEEEYEKLGLTVTDKEMNDMLYGANPPQELRQSFTDQKTGQYNAVLARQQITQSLKDPARKADIENFLAFLKKQRLQDKYMALMMNSLYFPKWFLEKQTAESGLMSKVTFASVPYSIIPDSTVQVTDADIQAYVSNHKSDFEQREETRSINYVLFNAAPSAADSAAAKAQVAELISQFATSNDPATFLNQQGSAFPYTDMYLSKNIIQVPAKDSIFTLGKGAIYGPYLDGGNYVLAKMIDSKSLPDSVKARHILIGTVDPQSGQPLMSDSAAKLRADSIATAIAKGANFDTLENKYSSDRAAHNDKGVMTFSSQDIQSPNFAKEFGQFILFDGQPGSKKVIKTQFGYHYIEIMEFKNVSPHYKVAYLSKQIFASPETEQTAQNAANLFAGNSRNQKEFDANYDKTLRSQGYPKLVGSNITPMSYGVQGINGPGRTFVKKVYDADKGDVIGPERVGDNYVVAVVTEVNEPGVQNAAAARAAVEPILRNKKKGEIIVKNIGTVTTPEEVAAKNKTSAQTIDSVRFGRGSQLSYEPKVIGAIFNPANKGKVVPEAIAGSAGVYVVRVEDVYTVPVPSANIDEQRKTLEMQSRQGMMSQMQQGFNPIIESLKRSAKIKDNRAKFF